MVYDVREGMPVNPALIGRHVRCIGLHSAGVVKGWVMSCSGLAVELGRCLGAGLVVGGFGWGIRGRGNRRMWILAMDLEPIPGELAGT